jgi:AraC-like DNA-binding protein
MGGMVGRETTFDLKERDMARLKREAPRGVIGAATAGDVPGHHARYVPEAPLDQSLEHFWSVSWRLPPGEQVVRQTLPHPAFHVIVEEGAARVSGVARARFTRVLEGEGRVFGAKFWPGAFRGLLAASAATLTDRVVPFSDVVGAARAGRYGRAIQAAPDDHARVDVASRFFLELLPTPPADGALLQRLVQAAATDRSITTVEDLRARSGMHLRELQRWFRDAVGVSPKWVIQRYRLHEALAALEQRRSTVAQLAAELGYADQAHFARDFKRLVGVAPSAYARRERGA